LATRRMTKRFFLPPKKFFGSLLGRTDQANVNAAYLLLDFA